MYFVSPAWGGDDKTELESYVPLRLHFMHENSHFFDITGTLSSEGKIHIVVYRDRRSVREESIIKPTDEEWKEFFNAVERANIWGLGEEEEVLPRDMYSYLPSQLLVFWKFEVEYLDRILNIRGLSAGVDASVDVRGGNRLITSDHRRARRVIISRNLLIANEIEKIQEIFFAIQKLLGADFSDYDFNLLSWNFR